MKGSYVRKSKFGLGIIILVMTSMHVNARIGHSPILSVLPQGEPFLQGLYPNQNWVHGLLVAMPNHDVRGHPTFFKFYQRDGHTTTEIQLCATSVDRHPGPGANGWWGTLRRNSTQIILSGLGLDHYDFDPIYNQGMRRWLQGSLLSCRDWERVNRIRTRKGG